jgi:hypothetical protein
MNRFGLGIYILIVAVLLAVLLIAASYGDPPVTIIDAAAPLCPKAQPNPCDTTNCYRRDTKEIA